MSAVSKTRTRLPVFTLATECDSDWLEHKKKNPELPGFSLFLFAVTATDLQLIRLHLRKDTTVLNL
jgi:hypothetical protein